MVSIWSFLHDLLHSWIHIILLHKLFATLQLSAVLTWLNSLLELILGRVDGGAVYFSSICSWTGRILWLCGCYNYFSWLIDIMLVIILWSLSSLLGWLLTWIRSLAKMVLVSNLNIQFTWLSHGCWHRRCFIIVVNVLASICGLPKILCACLIFEYLLL